MNEESPPCPVIIFEIVKDVYKGWCYSREGDILSRVKEGGEYM
jgi:hypothetical protein